MGVDAKMVVTSTQPVTDEQIRRWSYLLASTLGQSTFWIDRKDNRHVLSRLTPDDYLYETLPRDVRDTLNPTVLQINWLSRYYGPGYERGSVAEITTTATLLQLMIPESTVYYGGDSEDLLDLIDIPFLLNHAATRGTGTYYTYGLQGDPVITCDFCNEPMAPYKWSGSNVSYNCLGCDNTAEAHR